MRVIARQIVTVDIKKGFSKLKSVNGEFMESKSGEPNKNGSLLPGFGHEENKKGPAGPRNSSSNLVVGARVL